MNKTLKYTLIGVSVAAIGAGTYYLIKKHKKNKESEELMISAEDAISAWKETKEDDTELPEDVKTWHDIHKEKMAEKQEWNAEAMDKKIDDMISWKMNEEKKPLPHEILKQINKAKEKEEELNNIMDKKEILSEEEIMLTERVPLTGGDEKLRHDPNSEKALTQFMMMELAEWSHDEWAYQTLMNMFETPFEPIEQGDIYLKETIEDYRAQFFGPDSKWVSRVSFADLLLHYARDLEFNFGEGVFWWAEELLFLNDIDENTTPEELKEMLNRYCKHDYWSDPNVEEDGGFFRLKPTDIVNARDFAKRTVDGAITFNLEYNEFCKGRM